MNLALGALAVVAAVVVTTATMLLVRRRAFESYDASRTGAGTEATIVAQATFPISLRV